MEEGKRVLGLFEQIANREEEIRDIRSEIKDAIEQFCEEFDNYEPKVIREAYRFFKKLAKDKSEAMDVEIQREKLIELLTSSNTVQ